MTQQAGAAQPRKSVVTLTLQSHWCLWPATLCGISRAVLYERTDAGWNLTTTLGRGRPYAPSSSSGN